MSKYVLIIIWISICASIAYSGRFQRTEMVLGVRTTRMLPWFACLVFVPIIWMAANRGYFSDTSVYIQNFKSMPEVFAGIAEYMNQVHKDKGFSFFSCLIKAFVTRNYKVYLGIMDNSWFTETLKSL